MGKKGSSLNLNAPGLRIMVISPQPWHGFRVSKHHYALELAARGHTVYFVDPPLSTGKIGKVRVSEIADAKGLYLVQYRPCVSYKLKFHARPLFASAMRLQAKVIARACGGNFDLVWDFDNTYVFSSLKHFGSRFSIFSAVDCPASGPSHGKKADVVFGIAETILAKIRRGSTPAFVLGHGLAPEFVQFGRERLQDNDLDVWKPINRVGYIGNLLSSAIDGDAILSIVSRNPSLQFHFFGPYEPDECGKQPVWLPAILRKENCHFHGLCDASCILTQARAIDAWLLFYDNDKDQNGGANSHKVLEYLSTGAPVVSSRLDAYADTGLLVMPPTKSNVQLPQLVSDLASGKFFSFGSARMRIEYALSRSYAKRLDQIIDCLLSNS